MAYFPNNTVANFRVKLAETIDLPGQWEVALVGLHYPHTWPTIKKGVQQTFLYNLGAGLKDETAILKATVPPAAHLFCACINLKRLGELFQVSNFNMASNAGGAHGGARRHSGRKKAFSSRKDYRKSWESHHKRIYLNVNIFNSWKEAKIEAGYSNSSDSDFAAHLLSLEFRRK